MRKRWIRVLAALCLILLAASATRAAGPPLEVNGRDYYGTVLTDSHGEPYVALDVVGPMLLGPQFQLEVFHVTLDACTFSFVPAGETAPRKMQLGNCVKQRGVVYAPLKGLMKMVGGSYEATASLIRVAYPPTAAVAPRPAPPSPRPSVAVTPSVSSPTPTPSPVPGETPPASSAPLTPEIAMAEATTANANAFSGASLIQKVEVYHPVSPDPADAIPRTDLAGLKVYVKALGASDQVRVTMWNGRTAVGEPAFRRQLTGFRGQQVAEKFVFVRLPLTVEAGWHTVRVEMNGKEFVDYRFVTY